MAEEGPGVYRGDEVQGGGDRCGGNTKPCELKDRVREEARPAHQSHFCFGGSAADGVAPQYHVLTFLIHSLLFQP